MIAALNEFSARWGDAIWKASWQGGIALVLAFVAGWAIPRTPPRIRCWIWRLAVLKLLIAAMWTAPIELRWLSAEEASAVAMESASLPEANSRADATSSNGPIELNSVIVGSSPSAASGLLIAWALGVTVSVINWLRSWVRIRRVRLHLEHVTDCHLLRFVDDLCRRIGIRRRPIVCVASDSTGPFLIGSLRPMIVLPSVLIGSGCEPQLNVALAHELAHVKRRDLLWNWLWMWAAALFFFHPFVWLAKREWSLAQEIATDELALSVSRLPAATYAQTLVALAARHAAAGCPIFAIAVTESYSQLSRRIVAMNAPQLSRRFRAILMLTVLVFAAIGVVPWRLVAQDTVRPEAADPVLADSVQEEEEGDLAPSLSFGLVDIVAGPSDEGYGEADVMQALRFGLVDVVVGPSNHDELKLTPEQRRRIRSYASHIKSVITAALRAEADSRIGEVFDLSMRQERMFENKLRSELLHRQIELAESIILRERAKLGGIRAIVESNDLKAVTELALERPATVIDSHLFDAFQKANDQTREIRKELQKLHDDFMQEASEIQQRAFDGALNQLGEDGKKLRGILRQITDQDSTSLPTSVKIYDADALRRWGTPYRLAEAIVSGSNHKYLQLTLEQRRRIEDLHGPHATHVNELVSASWGSEPGTTTIIDDSFPPPDQGPEFQAEMKRLERQFENALRRELEPFQIELAEDVVLRKRFERGGLLAVVASTDLPDVAELKIERAPVESRLKSAAETANAEILELREKLDKAVDELQKKAREIQEREVETALKDLGTDGDKLRRIMAQAASVEGL